METTRRISIPTWDAAACSPGPWPLTIDPGVCHAMNRYASDFTDASVKLARMKYRMHALLLLLSHVRYTVHRSSRESVALTTNKPEFQTVPFIDCHHTHDAPIVACGVGRRYAKGAETCCRRT